MNPYQYSQFKDDATESLKILIKDGFLIKRLEDWGIWLIKNNIELQFYFEGTALQAYIKNITTGIEISALEYLQKNGMSDLYPIGTNQIPFEEWNKKFMKSLAEVFIINPPI